MTVVVDHDRGRGRLCGGGHGEAQTDALPGLPAGAGEKHRGRRRWGPASRRCRRRAAPRRRARRRLVTRARSADPGGTRGARRGAVPTACAPPQASQEGREAAGRRRGGGQGAGFPLSERPEDLTGGQGSALASSRGRSRCRTPAFARLSRKAGRKREGILRSIKLGVPDAHVEAASDKIKVATGQDYESPDIDSLIALVMPGCSDLRPTLPER